jgi:hypothetical protein
MFRNIVVIVVLFALSVAQAAGQGSDWQKLNTVEEVCRAYPERMKQLLQSFDLNRPGLEKTAGSAEKGDVVSACKQLLAYYKNGNSAAFLRQAAPETSQNTVSLADSVRQGLLTFYTLTDEVPTREDGHLNWHYEGPADDIEWAWALNRHYHLRILLNAYLDTGNDVYAETINRHIIDWVTSSLPYPGVKSSTAMWRGLEVSFRVKRWAEVFYGLIDNEHFSPAARLLLLSSIPEHAHYLRNFHAQGNWLTMEMSALATGAIAWREFREAASWLEYSKTAMTESLQEQVYPDGVQTELTAHYHRVALSNFELFLETFQKAGESLPSIYAEQIEQMWNYLAYSLRPAGTNPLNNDSDLNNYQDAIAEAAEKFDRPDWLYIARNGKAGKAPQTASVIFPYAGQAIMRNGWEREAHWSFFDIGPWGSGHQHNDKLHLSVAAYGRDLLVDAGRFAYRGAFADKFRPYAQSSAGHNLLIIDGKGQADGPKEAEAPLDETHFVTTKQYDYAWGSFDQFEELPGKAEHIRSVTYVKNEFWLVVDQIKTELPRQVEALWHWHPDCAVEIGSNGSVSSKNEHGNLMIQPVGRTRWKVELIKGREIPQPQGWYSVEYNKGEPNTASIFQTEAKDGDAFVWLIIPAAGEVPKVKAKIISRGSKGLQVRVKSKRGKWQLFVPFADSKSIVHQFTP